MYIERIRVAVSSSYGISKEIEEPLAPLNSRISSTSPDDKNNKQDLYPQDSPPDERKPDETAPTPPTEGTPRNDGRGHVDVVV